MILVDSNLLVYATIAASPHHTSAKAWLDDQFECGARIGLPWQSLAGYVRVVTHPRITNPPRPVQDAWAQVEEWLDHPRVWIPEPTGSHRSVFGRLLQQTAAHAGIANDADLAALAVEHGLIVCSADTDFAKFPGLHWRNPLTGGEFGVAERSSPYGASPTHRKRGRRG